MIARFARSFAAACKYIALQSQQLQPDCPDIGRGFE